MQFPVSRGYYLQFPEAITCCICAVTWIIWLNLSSVTVIDVQFSDGGFWSWSDCWISTSSSRQSVTSAMHDQSSFINASISCAPSCPSIATDNLSFVCSSFSFNLLKQFLTFLLKIFNSYSSCSASLMRFFPFSSSFSSKFLYLVLFPFKNEDVIFPAMVFPFCVIQCF